MRKDRKERLLEVSCLQPQLMSAEYHYTANEYQQMQRGWKEVIADVGCKLPPALQYIYSIYRVYCIPSGSPPAHRRWIVGVANQDYC